MRPLLVAVGVVVLVVGLALWYLPMPGQSASAQVPDNSGYVIQGTGPLAILSTSFAYSASWSAATSVNVSVYDCGTSSNCTNLVVGLTPITAFGNGTSGSLSWAGARGHYFAIVPSNAATITWTYQVPLLGGAVGVGLTVLGALVLLVGLIAKPPAKK